MPSNNVIPEWFRAALAQPSQSLWVEVAGGRLHLRGWDLEHRHKPLILLMHGFGGHGGWWDAVAPCLTGAYRVAALDLSGMGDSVHRADYPRLYGAHDIIGTIEALGDGPVIGIGHSSGGVRLLQACAERPDLFRRLVAIDSYVVFEGERHPERPAKVRGDKVYPDLVTALARYRLLPEQPLCEPWALAHIARLSLREVEGGWRWKFDPNLPVGIQYEDDGQELLPRVSRPVHYIYGEASSIISSALARRIVGLLPQGHGPIGIPGGYHHLMIDQPAALIATLRALLA